MLHKYGFKELSLYCYRTGGVITQLAAQIYGYRDHSTQKFAHDLGVASQLAHLLCQLRPSLEQNRLYLPEEDLRHFHVEEEPLLHFENSAQFKQLMDFQLQRIEEYQQRAMRALPDEDRYAQLPHLILLSLQLTMLREIAGDGWALLQQKTALTPLRKLWLSWKTVGAEKQRQRKYLARQPEKHI